MDDEELSRHVVVTARGELRSEFRDELWSELTAELDGSSLPLASRPTDRVRRRTWMVAVGAAAAAVAAVAGAVALWPQDESTLRGVGGADSTAPSERTHGARTVAIGDGGDDSDDDGSRADHDQRRGRARPAR